MALPVRDKYYLRSVHEEIGLYDRKLAHLLKHEVFACEDDRASAAGKLSAKRNQLVSTAREIAGSGIEFKVCDLPRSMRSSPDERTPGVSSTADSD